MVDRRSNKGSPPPLVMPDGEGVPIPDVWQSDGTFDTKRAETIFEETKNWPPEQRAAMLTSLRAAEVRARVRIKYKHPAQIAAAVNRGYKQTPAITLISKKIETVIRSPRKINLLVTMPPQEGKSSLVSVWSVIRALQLDPNKRIILATYGQELAEMHSRTAREVIGTYGTDVLDKLTGLPVEDRLGLKLARGANKVSAWSVEGGAGGMVAAGIGATITGRPADLFIIDDPFKNMMEADSHAHREKVELWFSSVVLSRLAPDASIIMIQCMTGDTPVLRPDGTETPLTDIRPGDEIATYDAGVLGTSRVMNWASQGYDSVYAITMESGRVVRANARHPFLVLDDDGVESWVKLELLQPGDVLMAIASTTGSPAPSATSLSTAKDCASRTTTKCGGPGATLRSPSNNDGTVTSNTAMASAWLTTTACSPSKAVSAGRAVKNLARTIARRIGRAFSASIIATRPTSSEVCSAMTATSSSDVLARLSGCANGLTISTDTVSAIEPCGVAEVFDIQVERTENFIANGLVSHNTRWHPEDLAGKVLAGEKLLPDNERTWHHVNIPAIAEKGIPDALNRKPGTPMISARDTPDAKRDFPTTRKQVGERTWYALYQGSPRNPAGGLFMRAWFKPWLEQIPTYPLKSVVGVDPADSGEGDEAGIIGGMLMADGRVALTHDRSGQYTSDQWARVAVILALEMGATEIAVESYSAATTYVQTVKRAYLAIHNEAIEKHKAGAALTPVEQRAVPYDLPPFMVTKWRGGSKMDAVARSTLIRQAFETGKCRTVIHRLSVFEDQAADWQEGQHQPDRVAAAVIAHDKLSGGGTMHVAGPVNRDPQPPPAWMRRTIGN